MNNVRASLIALFIILNACAAYSFDADAPQQFLSGLGAGFSAGNLLAQLIIVLPWLIAFAEFCVICGMVQRRLQELAGSDRPEARLVGQKVLAKRSEFYLRRGTLK
jgi:hypothetical protein